MIRFLYPVTVIIFLLFSLLISAAIAFGNGQPPVTALAGFAPCETNSWCWFGISPDRTSATEVDRLLTAAGYTTAENAFYHYVAPADSNLCDVRIFQRFGETILFALVLECENLTVGDLTTVLGSPTGVAVTDAPHSGMGFDPPPALVFGEALIGTEPQWNSLYGNVSSIWFTRTSSTSMTVHEWSSFNAYALCQFSPFLYGC
jgi:hypothetical protein